MGSERYKKKAATTVREKECRDSSLSNAGPTRSCIQVGVRGHSQEARQVPYAYHTQPAVRGHGSAYSSVRLVSRDSERQAPRRYWRGGGDSNSSKPRQRGAERERRRQR